MKKRFLLIASLLALSNEALIAHKNPTPYTTPFANTPAKAVATANAAWYRGGNNNTGPAGNANIFGTKWNSPIYTQTFGITRMKLNGNIAYGINFYPATNRNGFLLIGYSQTYSAGTFTGSATGAYSQLHLNGDEGSLVATGGYRPWMRTGTTFTDNNDLSYMGIRKVGTGLDVTETVISWSDNAGNTSPGPDDMAFRFTSGGGDNSISTTNLIDDGDLDGLHIARFTPTGSFGLGNTFGTNPTGTPAGLSVRPQSLAHYSLSDLRSVWQQYTNRNIVAGTGTGEGAGDGLRIGIIGNANALVNGTAAMYNQENRHLLFSTNANTNTMNVLSGATQERMRITAVGTPTNLTAGGFGYQEPTLVMPMLAYTRVNTDLERKYNVLMVVTPLIIGSISNRN